MKHKKNIIFTLAFCLTIITLHHYRLIYPNDWSVQKPKIINGKVELEYCADIATIKEDRISSKFPIIINGIKLTSDHDNFAINAEIIATGKKRKIHKWYSHYKDAVDISQVRTGQIFQQGDEFSRLYTPKVKDGEMVFTDIKELPVLTTWGCIFIDRLFTNYNTSNNCLVERTEFSSSTKAAYVFGYDLLGLFRSYVFGLKKGVIDISWSKTPIPVTNGGYYDNSGYDLMAAPVKYAAIYDYNLTHTSLFDGDTFIPCQLTEKEKDHIKSYSLTVY